MTGVDLVAVAAIVGAAASAASAGYAMSQSAPGAPSLPTPPAPPTPVLKAPPKAVEGDTATQQARRASAKARSAPRPSTLLTGVLGAPQSQGSVKTTVLGGNK